MMKEIGAAKFKEQCLALLDQLDAEGLVVTKHGKPVARVLPYNTQNADLIGSLRHKVKIRGDVFTTGIRWDADDQS
ncbi:MAG: type II toxin-antitoxin system Phd/YefM family antitoxin [Chloroflexota bacterium]|nr:type II toxin-antitoxin system Phd/YefM family antitoxin [Chloroflexota bacterium]MDE2823899.1 type II toxin-antitoxin system Phd/YefM family antitoxin [Chloroflexota bacterium]